MSFSVRESSLSDNLLQCNVFDWEIDERQQLRNGFQLDDRTECVLRVSVRVRVGEMRLRVWVRINAKDLTRAVTIFPTKLLFLDTRLFFSASVDLTNRLPQE